MANGSPQPLLGILASDSTRQLFTPGIDKEGGLLESQRENLLRLMGPAAPLSFAQERLWFLQQWEPANPAYNLTRAFRLRGALDRDCLARSVEVVLQRHEVLRSIFFDTGEQVFQSLLPPSAVTVGQVELRHRAKLRRESEWRNRIAAEAGQPFDLAQGPLILILIFQLADDDYVLLLSAHQSVFDGRSLDLFYREVESLYAAGGKIDGARLPTLPMQYADYAVWQRNRGSSAELKPQLDYWKARLQSPLPLLELPTNRPRTDQTSFKGARRKIAIDMKLTAALKALSRKSATTLFVTLMAAYKVLLHRYTGATDIVIGFPVSNRDRPELENLIGSFVNTLPLRSDLSGAPTFRAYLDQLRMSVQGALVNRDLPFERMVEELALSRDLSHAPIFQTMFTFQNRLPADFRLAGMQVAAIDCDSGGAKFDLTLALGEINGELLGSFEYRSDLFDAATIDVMIGHYQTLLRGVVADPDCTIAALPLLRTVERRRLLTDWNETAVSHSKIPCVHQLFEIQARKTPNQVALECGGERLTYQELNRRADRLAWHLRGLGIDTESIVAICLERSVEMVISLLGILKSGAAYLPLDPDYPGERLEFMLNDARVAVVITDKRVAKARGWNSRYRNNKRSFVLLAAAKQIASKSESAAYKIRNQPGGLAYLIYTSGSIGLPKGVEIEHRALTNCLLSMRRQLKISKRDIWLAVTTISFDIAAAEIFLPLISGARLVVASRDEARDGERLGARIQCARATIMQATPSTWRLLTEADWNDAKSLVMLCGGEALQPQLAKSLLSRGKSLWNFYGPTEATIWSASCKIACADGPIPIGRPLANTKIYLLDAALQPVPVGVTGEIYIGGAGVARGYLNQRGLTRERFMPNPFVGGERLYRTGDLARYLPDGNIEYLGRADNQVKLRGHRVELGEIEAVLGRHPLIKECAVVARDAAADASSRFPIPDFNSQTSTLEKQLVGYVVTNSGISPEVGALRSFLRKTLPEFMVPARFLFLDALPLTLNGKIDRKALPAPNEDRPKRVKGSVAPRDDVEELIAQVWREILARGDFGVNDNFFDLGGYSLLATRVASRLRVNFGIELSLRKVFELPTIAQLAAYVNKLHQTNSATASAPIVPVSKKTALPLSSAQQRLWFLQKVDPQLSAYNIPAAYKVDGPLNIAALEASLNLIVQRHESLRTAIAEVAGQAVQRVLAQVVLTLPLIDLAQLAADRREAEVTRIVNEDAHLPFDLGHAPLMRVQLLRLGMDAHVLVCNFHHIIADASSLASFYRELAIFYDAGCTGNPAALAPLALQFADYASWQREWLASTTARAQMSYWRRQLAGLTPIDLPADFVRSPRQNYRGARVSRVVPMELTSGLKRLSQRSGVTLFMTLLAALDVLLARLSGRADIVVGSTATGRHRAELEGMIGFLINALTLRCDLSGNPSFVDLLRHVREVCLDGYSHQDLPFDKIVEAVKPERDLSRNPLFQVMFNLNEVGPRSLILAGCRVEKLALADPSVKFDIVLYAPEIDGLLNLTMAYNADLFTEARVGQMLEQLGTILAQAVAAPDTVLDQFSLLTPSARPLLPDPTLPLGDAWRGAVHEWMLRHARAAPETTALVDSLDRWTYRDIDEQSSRLANRLIRNGIQQRDVVAIYAQRRPVLAAAILAVLKAGAVFVILDPAYPAGRLCDYLRIVRPKGWLQFDTAEALAEDIAAVLDNNDLRCRLTLPLSLQPMAAWLADESVTAPELSLAADDPAYIAFTSGSTGEPKGVLCRHGPMSHFLPWQEKVFSLRSTDRYCLLSGLGYNHLQREIFTALASGAELHVPSAAQMGAPERLAEWLRQREITVLHLTPALGRLLHSAGAEPLPALRRIFFGGDLLTRQDVDAMRHLAPNAQMICFYGATETQRAVGYYKVEGDDHDAVRKSAILPTGRGAEDVQLLVLGASGQLAGVGELGALFLRSPHLASGYVGDLDLTARTFLVNPFTQVPCDRLYRTGDLARYRPDGNVEWVGRSDRRVNIRGFRVELAEVESVLLQHPMVRAAVVVDSAKLQDTESKISERLIAYVVADDSKRMLISDVRDSLSAKLPHYMVPAEFIQLARLPLTPNGKVDYAGLPAPATERDVATPFEAPVSELERSLADIFAEVLEVGRVGRWDDFFQCGGHSLLAAQAAARIRDRLQVSLQLVNFLEAPTVASLARHLKSTRELPACIRNDREEIEI